MQRGMQGADLTVEDLVGPTNGFDVNDLSVNSFGGYDDDGVAGADLNVTQDSVAGFSDHNASAEMAVEQLLDALRRKEAENTALKERTRRLEHHERTLEDKVANLDTELEAVSVVVVVVVVVVAEWSRAQKTTGPEGSARTTRTLVAALLLARTTRPYPSPTTPNPTPGWARDRRPRVQPQPRVLQEVQAELEPEFDQGEDQGRAEKGKWCR